MTTSQARRTRLVLVASVAATALVAACQPSRPGDPPADRSAHPPIPRSHAAPAGLYEQVDFVQFRWEDSSSRRELRYVEPMNNDSVALNDSVVLDIRGIDSAWTSPAWHDAMRRDVDLLLSREGAARFGATTATHAGHRLAVVLDGKIVQMPIIVTAMGPRALLLHGAPHEVADSLATRVNRAVAAMRPYLPVMFPRDLVRRTTQ